MAKIGRNEACPCGSGKKYKKCCWNQEETQLIEKSKESVLSRNSFSNNKIIINNSDDFPFLKMSRIIREYAEELIEQCKSFAQKEYMIGLAVIAWNGALLEGEELEHYIGSFVKKFANSRQKEQELRDILDTMILKKKIEYPDINRQIIDFNFINTKHGDGHLTVVSTVVEKAA